MSAIHWPIIYAGGDTVRTICRQLKTRHSVSKDKTGLLGSIKDENL